MPGQVFIGYRRDDNKYQAGMTDKLKNMKTWRRCSAFGKAHPKPRQISN